MSIKVAVASSDGKVINSHFGRANQFLVFSLSKGSYEFIETRENSPACSFGDHSEDSLDRSIDIIKDCQIVLASQIGPGAEKLLGKRGIKVLSGSSFLDDVLYKLSLSSYIKMEYPNL